MPSSVYFRFAYVAALGHYSWSPQVVQHAFGCLTYLRLPSLTPPQVSCLTSPFPPKQHPFARALLFPFLFVRCRPHTFGFFFFSVAVEWNTHTHRPCKATLSLFSPTVLLSLCPSRFPCVAFSLPFIPHLIFSLPLPPLSACVACLFSGSLHISTTCPHPTPFAALAVLCLSLLCQEEPPNHTYIYSTRLRKEGREGEGGGACLLLGARFRLPKECTKRTRMTSPRKGSLLKKRAETMEAGGLAFELSALPFSVVLVVGEGEVSSTSRSLCRCWRNRVISFPSLY